jgi:hypothetical protein
MDEATIVELKSQMDRLTGFSSPKRTEQRGFATRGRES